MLHQSYTPAFLLLPPSFLSRTIKTILSTSQLQRFVSELKPLQSVSQCIRPKVLRHTSSICNNIITCATFNIRSLSNKLEALKQLSKDENISIICLTETWLENDPVDLRRLRTEGYQVIERARPLKPGAKVNSISYVNHGGVAIIGPTGIRLSQLKTGSPKTFEHLCVRVSSQSSSCIILLIYRPGSSPATQQFFDGYCQACWRNCQACWSLWHRIQNPLW